MGGRINEGKGKRSHNGKAYRIFSEGEEERGDSVAMGSI